MPFVFTDGLGTTGESATLKTADAVATQVDAAVMQTIEKSLDAIKAAPDLAADIKQGLYEFLKGQQLTVQQVEAAGIPRGFFDDIPRGAAKDDTFFAMSTADNFGANKLEGEINLRHKAGAGGDWPKINERPSPEVVQQTERYSCVSASGEILTNGEFKQIELIKKLGMPCDTRSLADVLGPPWIGKGLGPDKLDYLLERGRWAAELRELPSGLRYRRIEPGHTVVVDGLDGAGNIRILDPADGTIYEMARENFLKHWTGLSVWK